MKLVRIYQTNPIRYGEVLQYICPYLCNKVGYDTEYLTLSFRSNKLNKIWIDKIDTNSLIKWEKEYKHTLVPLKDTHELT